MATKNKRHEDRQRPHPDIHEAHDLISFGLQANVFEKDELEGAEITQRTLCWVLGHADGDLVARNFAAIRERLQEASPPE